MNIQMVFSKMRLEASEYMWKTRVILTHLENYYLGKCTGSLGEKLDES